MPRQPSTDLPLTKADNRGTARSRSCLSCVARPALSRATPSARRPNAARQSRRSATCFGVAAAVIASARIKCSTDDCRAPSATFAALT